MKFVVNEMEKLLNTSFDGVEIKQGKNIKISVKNGKKTVEYGDESCLSRALAILKMKENDGDFEYSENPFFKMRCVMLDMSRNAVMKVCAVKKYLLYIVLHQLNLVDKL